jgi:CheY-like chemotaxis protein
MERNKVLVVDDDTTSKMLLEMTLNKYFREVLTAENGLEAVKTCKKNPDIDVIFMDLRMPVMDGIDAIAEIRKFNKDVIIIAQTALTDMREESIDAGSDEYLRKPLLAETLITTINFCAKKKKKILHLF